MAASKSKSLADCDRLLVFCERNIVSDGFNLHRELAAALMPEGCNTFQPPCACVFDFLERKGSLGSRFDSRRPQAGHL